MATALPPAADSALHATDEKAYFQRLTRLLVCGGITLLREVFDSIHPPANLPTVLAHHKSQLWKLRNRNVINQQEWSLLYPSPGVYGNSTDFDITLIFKLLRNICNLTPPFTGWDNLPNTTDLSPEADLVRIKFYRNEVYGHSKNMEISDAKFVDLWREISEALLRIAGRLSVAKNDEWKKSIDKFLRDPLTPDSAQSLAELQSWYKKDMDLKDMLEKQDIQRQQQMNFIIDILNEIKFKQCESFGNSGQLPTVSHLQEAGQQTGSVCIPISPEQPQAEEAAGSQTNQQISSPDNVDIWHVILSFKNAFKSLVEYLRKKLGVDVEDSRLGSLIITVSCRSLQVLEGLWEDYQSGHLNETIQATLVTAEVLKELGLSELKLKTTISEEEYKACKEQLTQGLAALPELHRSPGSDDSKSFLMMSKSKDSDDKSRDIEALPSSSVTGNEDDQDSDDESSADSDYGSRSPSQDLVRGSRRPTQEYESRDIEALTSSSLTGIFSKLRASWDRSASSDPKYKSSEIEALPSSSLTGAIGGTMKYKAKTGHVLVIDNCTAVSAEKSASFHVQPLLDLYANLGFTIQGCNNLTKSAMLKVLEDTAEKDFTNYACFVCVIVSHGSVEGKIYGTDDKVISLQAITALFNCSRCPQLEGKPKIFLIEAFQEAEPTKIPSSGPFSSASFLEGDFLICYACSPGPAVFLTFIAKVFEKYSKKEHILDMMLRVNRLAEPHFKMQRPWQLSTLTKKVYFSFL